MDSVARELLVLSPTGAIARTITGGVAPFGEPFDVAVDDAGTVYVLDSEGGSIILFTPDGDYMRTITPADASIERSRGMAVDATGRIWIAHTPGQRLVVLSTDGALLHEYPVWPDTDAQVTDVAVMDDGTPFAVAMGVNKLIQYDDLGNRVGAWDVAPANTLDGPHLAAGDGAAAPLFVTQPEEGRVVLHAADGAQGAYWQLPRLPDMVKPVGIAVAADGSFWVTDVQGGRVVRLAPQPQ